MTRRARPDPTVEDWDELKALGRQCGDRSRSKAYRVFGDWVRERPQFNAHWALAHSTFDAAWREARGLPARQYAA